MEKAKNDFDTQSVWGLDKVPRYPELTGNLKQDIVVVGGGIAGVLAAYRLSERGHNVTLAEAETLGSGTTCKTTAHISALHGIEYLPLVKTYGEKRAADFFNSQQRAIDSYEDVIVRNNIDCDFERVPAYLYTESKNPDNFKREYGLMKKLGFGVEFFDKLDGFPAEITAAFGLKQAKFNPMKFIYGLPKNFEIFEKSRVKGIDLTDKTLYTDKGSIKADIIIFATKYPVESLRNFYFAKIYQSQDYAIAVKSDEKIGALYTEDKEDGFCMRGYGGYIILDGLDHRSGRVNSLDKFQTLHAYAKKLFPYSEPAFDWDANDCVTFDGIPYIGRMSKRLKDVYVITGFNKWGMAHAMTASELIADLIENKANPYEELFSPLRRRNIYYLPDFLKNAAAVTLSLAKAFVKIPFKTAENLKTDSGGIVFYKGRRRAVYKDADGRLYPINRMCPHMKCELEWNGNTHTWDCPCHGSRFDIHGNIITAPTVFRNAK